MSDPNPPGGPIICEDNKIIVNESTQPTDQTSDNNCKWCHEFLAQSVLCSGCKVLYSYWNKKDSNIEMMTSSEARKKFISMDYKEFLLNFWVKKIDNRLPYQWFHEWIEIKRNLIACLTLFWKSYQSKKVDLRILDKKTEVEFKETNFPESEKYANMKIHLQTIKSSLTTYKQRTLITAKTAERWLKSLSQQYKAHDHYAIVHAIVPSVIDPWHIQQINGFEAMSVLNCYYRDFGYYSANHPPDSFSALMKLWRGNGLDRGGDY